MTDASEADIRAECQEWASGKRYPQTDEGRAALRQKVESNPDGWWRVLKQRVTWAPDQKSIRNLALGPLQITLESGDQRMLDEAVAIAKFSSKMATALVDGPPCNRDFNLYALLGRDYVVESYLRYLVGGADLDFWAWTLIHDLVESDADEAWLAVQQLIERAPNEEILGLVAASPLEDFIMSHSAESIDRIEAEARRSGRFREALAGVWIMRLRPDLLDRIEAAAGTTLRRE